MGPFKLFLYGGLVNKFNIRGFVETNGSRKGLKFKPRDAAFHLPDRLSFRLAVSRPPAAWRPKPARRKRGIAVEIAARPPAGSCSRQSAMRPLKRLDICSVSGYKITGIMRRSSLEGTRLGIGEVGLLDEELYRLARGAGRLRLRIGQALHRLGDGYHELGFSTLGAYALERCCRGGRWAAESRALARRLQALPRHRSKPRCSRWPAARRFKRCASR